MRQIQKVSSYLLWVFNFLLVAIPVWLLAQWVFVEWEPFKNLMLQGIVSKSIETPEGWVNLANLTLTPLSWSIGFLGSLLGLLPSFLSILILKRLFQNYREGNIFSFKNVQKYQYLGCLLFFDALFIKPLTGMMMVLTATLSNPPGHRYISLNFGTPNLEVIFWGVLVIVISWIMAEGYKLQEDQSLTV